MINRFLDFIFKKYFNDKEKEMHERVASQIKDWIVDVEKSRNKFQIAVIKHNTLVLKGILSIEKLVKHLTNGDTQSDEVGKDIKV